MQQANAIRWVSKVADIFNRVAHLFGGARLSTSPANLTMANIDWPDSGSRQANCESDGRPVSGGYNEAFIVQYWTSYHLR